MSEDGIDAGGDRYAVVNLGDGEWVIYDKTNHTAWIQSSVSVSVAQWR